MKKIISSIFIILGAFFLYSESVNAGSLEVYVSNTSPYVGTDIVVTVKASGLAGNFSITSSNGAVLSGGVASDFIDDATVTYKFKSNAAGSATITVIPKDVADYSTNSAYTASKSVTVTVKNRPVVVLSSNNYLSSLGIEGVGISPEFNKEQLEYAVEMEPGTTKINIVGSLEDGTAGVEGLGEKEVIEGANRFEIRVTAQNGNSRTYVLNVNVKEYNPIEANVNGSSYSVVRKRTELITPSNYVETIVMIGEEEVPAYYSEITNYTLVGLKDKTGTIGYYIYDSEANSYKEYQEFSFQRIVLYPMKLKEIPARYHASIVVINDKEVTAYKLKESSNYALIYGMNVETGKANLYLYNSEENTLQIYYDEEIKLMEEEKNLYQLIGLCLGGVCLFLLLILIIVICRKGKRKDSAIEARHKKKKEKKKKNIELSISDESVS